MPKDKNAFEKFIQSTYDFFKKGFDFVVESGSYVKNQILERIYSKPKPKTSTEKIVDSGKGLWQKVEKTAGKVLDSTTEMVRQGQTRLTKSGVNTTIIKKAIQESGIKEAFREFTTKPPTPEGVGAVAKHAIMDLRDDLKGLGDDLKSVLRANKSQRNAPKAGDKKKSGGKNRGGGAKGF